MTRRVPVRVYEELERVFSVSIHDSELPLRREELLRRVEGASGLVTMLTDRVDAELIDAAGPRLRVVANYAVGVDNVDVEGATRRGVTVANTPAVLTRATAELTLGLVLALTRRLCEGDRLIRAGEPWAWAPTFMVGDGLQGKTIGLVGYGSIGREVARLAARLGMEVAYTTRSRGVPLADLLSRADVVSLHVPLTRETRHLIGTAELARMRSDAYLVNVSRGAVVDEEALAQGLGARKIAGAALDVFEREPDVAAALLALPNVVLTPHIGSATRAAREAMGMLCVQALRAVLVEGRRPANAVS